MSKGLEALESLDKLEECAYAMKDLPMSNWIDLANNEAELDLKIMDWVETIKFELFKGKQALQRLEAIDNSNPSEALKYVNGKIADLEDDLQHYTIVEKDKCKEFYIREDLKQFTNIQQALLKAQEQEKENKELIRKSDCCLWKDCNKISQENQELKDKLNLGNALCSSFWYNNKQVVLCTLEHYDDIMTENIRLKKAIKRAIELLSINEKILKASKLREL